MTFMTVMKCHKPIYLINPVVKARALLIKTMIRECNLKKIEVDDVHSLSLVYGYGEDLVRMMRQKKCSSKIIYDELMSDYLVKNNSIIPSRNEKRVRGIRWSVAWCNWSKSRGVDAQEKEFAWKLQQDMLPTGSRLHRPNVDTLSFFYKKQFYKKLRLKTPKSKEMFYKI